METATSLLGVGPVGWMLRAAEDVGGCVVGDLAVGAGACEL